METAAMADQDVKTFRAKCFCGFIHYTFSIPNASLPLPGLLCHCTICRWTTGAPCVFHSILPKGLRPTFIAPSTESNLTRYPVHDRTNDSCPICGAHVASISGDRDIWVVSTSLFTDHEPENIQITRNVFGKSSKNGAFDDLITHLGDRKLVNWNPPADRPDAKVVEPEREVGPDGKERLRIKCHCEGVSFTIPRPSQEMVEDGRLARCFKPGETTKWAAEYCVCDECRLVSGCHVVGWASIPLSICEPPIKQDLKIGTSKTYVSSPGVLRSFCGHCGTTIFYSRQSSQASDEPFFVDVAVGNMRALGGYMANDWLAWRSSVLHLKDMRRFDKDFADAIEGGAKTL